MTDLIVSKAEREKDKRDYLVAGALGAGSAGAAGGSDYLRRGVTTTTSQYFTPNRVPGRPDLRRKVTTTTYRGEKPPTRGWGVLEWIDRGDKWNESRSEHPSGWSMHVEQSPKKGYTGATIVNHKVKGVLVRSKALAGTSAALAVPALYFAARNRKKASQPSGTVQGSSRQDVPANRDERRSREVDRLWREAAVSKKWSIFHDPLGRRTMAAAREGLKAADRAVDANKTAGTLAGQKAAKRSYDKALKRRLASVGTAVAAPAAGGAELHRRYALRSSSAAPQAPVMV